MPVDVSMYAAPAQPNPLTQMGELLQLKAAKNNLLMFPGQQKLQDQAIQSGQTTIDQQKVDLAHKQFQIMSQGLGSLAQDPDLSADKLMTFGQQMVKAGLMPMSMYADEVKNIPKDPAQLRQYVQNLNVRALDAQQQFAQIYGTPSTVSNGQQLLPVTVSPIAGMRQIGAPIQQQMTPAELAAPAVVTTPDGRQVQTNIGGYNRLLQGGAGADRPGNVLMPQQPQPAQPPVAAPAPAPAPAANGTPASPAVDLGNGVTGIPGPPPGQVEAQKIAAEGGATQLVADRAAASNLRQGTFPLLQAIPALESLGTTGTGPGTETVNQMKSFIQSLGIPGFDPDTIKNYDEARKYLTQYVNGSGLPTKSVEGLLSQMSGSPSVNISNAAAVDVSKAAVALARMKAAGPLAFDKSGLPEGQYSKWLAQYSQSQDPRAFGLDLMKPDARTKLITSIKGMPADNPVRVNFLRSLRTAVDAGLIQMPGASNAPQ